MTYLTLEEAADYLRVSPRTFRRHVRPFVLCSYVGSKPVFSSAALDAYMTDHQTVIADRPKRAKGATGNLVRLNPKAADFAERL